MPLQNDPILEAVSVFSDRLLQDGNKTLETMPPTEENDDRAPFDDFIDPNGDDNLSNENGDARNFGIVVLAAISFVLLLAGWRSFHYWKIRREQYQLQVQSARADSVLGDMQVS
jgi:hypothetical protein